MTAVPEMTNFIAPVVETERLRLRGFRRDDLDLLAAMLGDPVVTLHLGGQPLSREESWRKLMLAVGQWSLLGFGYWAVETRDDGRFVGQIGFGNFERGLTVADPDLPEMGWIFSPATRGQGIAREAGVAALDWLGTARGTAASWAIISPDNIASLKLAGKLGFEREADVDYHGETIAVVRRS